MPVVDGIAQTFQVKLDLFLELVSGVIGTDRDSHKGILPWETVVVART
jgi:hypothetical protein